jgi:hypothetical protein
LAAPLPASAYAAVALVALLARIVWRSLGVRFDAGPLFVYWQFLDPAQLLSRPFEALLNLHSQPPALNVLAAVGLALFGSHVATFFGVLYAASGVAANVASFHLAYVWSGRRSLASAVLLVGLASPDAVLFENLFFTTHPVLVSLVLSAACLERLLRTGRLRWFVLYGVLLLATSATRSMYGTPWTAACLAVPFFFLPLRRRTLVTGLVILAAALLWPMKNGLLFGSWRSSSWMGMNFFNAVYNQSYTVAELEAAFPGAPARRVRPPGSSSPFGDVKPFAAAEVYAPFLNLRATGVPVLDALRRTNGATNYNWIGYIAVSNEYLREYERVLSRNPGLLATVLRSSLASYVRPASDNLALLLTPVSASNVAALRPALALLRMDFAVRVPGRVRFLVRPACILIGALVLLVLGGLPVLAFVDSRRRDAAAGLALFVLWNTAYVTVVGNLFENLENMRFRLEIEPLLLIAAAALVAAAWRTPPRALEACP